MPFSFRSDKTGFFSGLTLMVLVSATALATILILILGGWENYKVLLKWIWGTAWVACIITVLIRVAIFRFQMVREQGTQQESDRESPPSTPPPEGQ